MTAKKPLPKKDLLTEENKKRLLLRGQSERSISSADLKEIFGGASLSADFIGDVKSFLLAEGVIFEDAETAASSTSDAYTGSGYRERRKQAKAKSIPSIGAGASTDSIKMYLQEIGEVSLLSFEEEVFFAKKIKVGVEASAQIADLIAGGNWNACDREKRLALRRSVKEGDDATATLTAANLRLVVSIAKRYMGRGMPMLDLIQEGNLGLMRAVQKFDHSKGFKFSTYATWWIRQAVTRSIADQSRTIRVPIHMVESINRLTRVKRALSQNLEREPTVAELSEEVEMSESKVEEILQIINQDPMSLDMSIGSEEDNSMADFIPDKGPTPVDIAARKLLGESVQSVLGDLTEREAAVLRMRFGLLDGQPRTLEEVGKAFGVTRERIRQIESRTLAKLRHPLRSDGLKDYLS